MSDADQPASAKAPQRRTLWAGDRAVLVEVADLDSALGLHARLQERQASDSPIAGIAEILPAARTVLVRFRPWETTREALVDALDAIDDSPADAGAGQLVEIPVDYSGEDLGDVAQLLGLSVEDVIDAHTGSTYRAAFAGFAPGFVYLVDGDPRLDVPRRETPRTRIPAGSVGLAGTFSGVYPRQSPGGWQLLGTTTSLMWDVDREPPALVQPGDRVRFTQADAAAENAAASATAEPPTSADTYEADAGTGTATPNRDSAREGAPAALIVLSPGLHALFQDEGRAGQGHLGVSESGALDVPALRLANRLVGNPPSTTGVEMPYGGFSARARGAVTLAVTGAQVQVQITRADGSTTVVTDQRAIALDDGDSFAISAPTSGFRAMLAVRGGFAVPPVLGSTSTDTLAGLGPEPIQAGDELEVGHAAPLTAVGSPVPFAQHPTGIVELPIVWGPRDDWFDDASRSLLLDQEWEITAQADRVGLRLRGDSPLVRSTDAELPSEGAATGSIQVPPSGQPMIFAADHPLTGGYPIIGVVTHDALPLLAQATPGMRVRFTDGSAESQASAGPSAAPDATATLADAASPPPQPPAEAAHDASAPSTTLQETS